MAALLKFGRKRERNQHGATKVASELSADVTDFASSQRSVFTLFCALVGDFYFHLISVGIFLNIGVSRGCLSANFMLKCSTRDDQL